MQPKKTDILENFAVRLRAAMKRKGVTLQQVADACGVGVSTVGAWTQAKNWPQVEVQPRLAVFLQTSIHFLIHGITDKTEITDKVESVTDPKTTGGGYTQTESPATPSEEGAAPYGSEAEIEAELLRKFRALLKQAHGNRDRLGWIAEQFTEHLSPPKSWTAKRPLMERTHLPSETQSLSTQTGKPIPDHGRRAQQAS